MSRNRLSSLLLYSTELGAAGNVALDTILTSDEAQWKESFRELGNIATLQDDWDGLGATAPSKEVVAAAERFASIQFNDGAMPPTSVVASPDGTVLFNWKWPEEEVRAAMEAVPKKKAEGWVKRLLGTTVQRCRRLFVGTDKAGEAGEADKEGKA